jgi:uncharacterized protein
MSEQVWYQDGLRFACTRCGHCCRGPGFVWVDDQEIALLARHFDMEPARFEAVYTRKAGRGRSLREQANDDCIFYAEGQGCLVYESRPRQCRTWPFWEQNVETPRDWQRTQERCPGSGRGQLFTVEDITRRLTQTKL